MEDSPGMKKLEVAENISDQPLSGAASTQAEAGAVCAGKGTWRPPYMEDSLGMKKLEAAGNSDQPLCFSDAEEAESDSYTADAAHETMAFYPEAGKDRVKITRADYNLLDAMEMVNDTVIDFYFKWIEKELLFEGIAQQFLFFSTFFYKKLLNIKSEKSAADMLKSLQQTELFGIKDGLQIWDRKYLFVPINESFHWSLAVICIGPPAAAEP